MTCIESEQDHLLDSLVMKCCDKDNEELVVAPSQWSVLFSLPSQPKTLLESIALPPPPLPPLTSSLVKRTLPKTQKQNLELCTEILGSENGVLYPLEDYSRPEELRAISSIRKRRSAAASGFPPPLTILGGEDRLRLSTKRENGRLLLVPFVPSLLEAERSEGCLRLRLLPSKSSSPLCHPKEGVKDDMVEAVGLGEDEEEYMGVMESSVFGGNGEYRRIGRCKEEEDGVGPMGGGVRSRRNKVMLISV